MNKIEIYNSYNFGGWSLRFKKTFDIPFVPFYGMRLIFDDANEYSVSFENNDYHQTLIDYNVEKNQFEVSVQNWWKRPVSDETIDGVIEKYATWERVDITVIEHLKELMVSEQKRLAK